MQRLLTMVVTALILVAGVLAAPSAAHGAAPFPDTIGLPDGFFPEGIAIDDRRAFVGSLADGSIQVIDLRTGATRQLAPSPGPGTISVGMDVDRFGRLWVAGGGGAFPGIAAGFRVHDATSGDLLVDRAMPGAGFLNDVIVTDEAAWFTDSFAPVLTRVPIAADGSIGSPQSVALVGDWVQTVGFSANGIVATPDEGHLIVAQSVGPEGGPAYYAVPTDGDAPAVVAARIAVEGTAVGADGLVLVGRTLYSVGGGVVTELRLSNGLTEARVVDTLAVPGALTPTTADVFGSRLYVVDAKFPLFGDPATPYEVTAIAR